MAKKSKKKSSTQYGLNVTGKIRIWGKRKRKKGQYDFMAYWISLGKKDPDGDWLNVSLPVFFGKDDEGPESDTIINVNKAFMIVAGNDEKFARPGLFIQEWEEADDEEGDDD